MTAKKKQKGSFKHFSRQGEHHLIFCVQTFRQLYNINPYNKERDLKFLIFYMRLLSFILSVPHTTCCLFLIFLSINDKYMSMASSNIVMMISVNLGL